MPISSMMHCHLFPACKPCLALVLFVGSIGTEQWKLIASTAVLLDMTVIPGTATYATNAEKASFVLTACVPIAKFISASNRSNAIGSMMLVQHVFEDSVKGTISNVIFTENTQKK
jgi:hypothetical protein